MAFNASARNTALARAAIIPQTREHRAGAGRLSAKLPRLLRPGLAREALRLSLAMKNRYECVRGLYLRDRAPTWVEFRNGVRLESSSRDSLFFLVEEIVADRCYTPRWFYRPGGADVVVDVGANIGVFAAHICNMSPGARVVCFEPDPWSYGTLVRNISASNLSHRVQAHQAAVWREEGTVYLALASDGKSVGQRTLGRVDGAAAAADCINLEQALDLADPSGGDIALLKIDAEGAETDILEAAGASAMQRVRRVALEYHSAEKRKRCSELLTGYGFTIRFGIGNADLGVCFAYRTI